jgi:homoserine O-acetyltransferase
MPSDAKDRPDDWPTREGMFTLGDLPLLKGGVLRDARLSWRTHGTLSPARDNVIVYPTSYAAQTPELTWLIGPDGILDPERWFIVQPDMFGNGLSSSPSNRTDYPALVTAWDNVHAQKRLLAEVFGVKWVACVYGWSMGAQQAYHWAAAFPGDVERIVAVCGSARTAVHNQVFLRGLLAVLEAAPEYAGHGRFSAEPTQALRAFARIYAGWALSQDYYRAGLHLAGEPDLESFLRHQWEVRWLARRAANLHAQALCWHAGDISDNPLYGGDLARARSPPGRGRRHQRQPAVRRRPRPGAWRDRSEGAADARRDRSVFPRRRQRGRAAAPAPCRVAAHPQHPRPPRRQPAGQPGGHRVPAP